MPFKAVSELPENVRKLPAKRQRQWMDVFNSAWERYDPKKDKGHDPKKTLAQNREAFAFRVANGVVFGNRKEELAAVLGPEVPIASVLGRGVLPWRLVEATPMNGPEGAGKGRKKKRRPMADMMREVLEGRGAVAELVDAALDEALHDHTFSEIQRAVGQAVRAKFNATGREDVYAMEYFVGKVIVQVNGKLFEVPYDLDEETGEATLGKAKEVRVRFVPVGAP